MLYKNKFEMTYVGLSQVISAGQLQALSPVQQFLVGEERAWYTHMYLESISEVELTKFGLFWTGTLSSKCN